MKKGWIKKRKAGAEKLLAALGLTSLHELINCTVLIKVSYGKHDDGHMALAKPQQVNISKRTITFTFEEPFVDITLDAAKNGLGGDFEGYTPGFDFVITDLDFNGDHWTATTCEDGSCGQISKNIDVEIIPH